MDWHVDWATLATVVSGVAYLARKIGALEVSVREHAKILKQVVGHETRISRIEGRHANGRLRNERDARE